MPGTSTVTAGLRIESQTLSLFAQVMAVCLSSGLSPGKALELSASGTQSKALRTAVEVARNRCAQGMALSDALEPAQRVFPHYVLPVIRAGETGGRLVEAFQLLHDHARRLGPSLTLVRNTWLYPLVCVVFGWFIRTGIYVAFGKHAAAWHFVGSALGTAGLIALSGWIILQFDPVRKAIDLALLQIPIVREAELRLAVVLFFATFRLVYEAGGVGVLVMFDLAAKTIRNRAIRQDFHRARQVLEQQGSFGDAFAGVTLLENRFKGMIATGAFSGQLDRSLTAIVEEATSQLDAALHAFNQVFQRVVAFCVAMSIVETVFVCAL